MLNKSSGRSICNKYISQCILVCSIKYTEHNADKIKKKLDTEADSQAFDAVTASFSSFV